MPVDSDAVREGLPNRGGTRIDNDTIDRFIASFEEQVRRRIGPEYLETPVGIDIVLTGATGRALQIVDVDINSDSPQGRAMISQAEGLLRSFDEATSSPQETGAVNDDLVSQTISGALWGESDGA